MPSDDAPPTPLRLQLLSDLHLESGEPFEPVGAAGARVLVLAGDIGSYQPGSRLAAPDFGLARFSPRRPGAPWSTVLFVPGNHEYDGLEFDTAEQRLRATCRALGITWLEREAVVIDGVRFLGTTLWTDFDALADAPAPAAPGGVPASALTQRLRQREKAFRAADFYLRKHHTLRDGRPQLAEDIRALGLQAQAWLREALARPHDGPTVVVTHYAPTLHSADPRYGITPGTAGFCNALDELLPQADLWLHGHLHCANDHVVTGRHADGRTWRTRIVANPLGYARKGEQADFRPDRVIEVPDRRTP